MDDDQQFCLRWNNHQSTLISVFDTLLENGTLVDCTLAAEGKFLKAHKVVLSACSPYFAALLSQQYDKHPIFILKDVKFQELRAMMDYMYRGEVNISQDQLAALLKAAESLQIKGLSDNRSGSNSNNTNSTNMPSSSQSHLKSDAKTSHVPAPKASGLTIENKRPLLRTIGSDFDADMSGSREGSVSPSIRKRKKVNQRRKSLAESNSLLENHDQHSNSSSHSNNNQQQLSINTSATSATSNLMSVTKKTEHQSDMKNNQQESHNSADNEDTADEEEHHERQHLTKRSKHDEGMQENKQESELMIEPKNEYDDDDDNDGNVEDLTQDEEELLEDLDQAGPSHGGEGSSQGYHWQMDGRSQDGSLMAQEAAGQQRDAQAEDLSITKIAGLTWDQWNAQLAMPLVTTFREGAHPLVFPRDLCVSPMESKVKNERRSPTSGNNNTANGSGNGNNTPTSADGFTCPDCGRMYKLKSSLRNHQKWECGKEPQFQCPYCVYRAKQKMHIGRHMERMHKEKFYKVEGDGKVIALEEALSHIVQATSCDFNSTI